MNDSEKMAHSSQTGAIDDHLDMASETAIPGTNDAAIAAASAPTASTPEQDESIEAVQCQDLEPQPEPKFDDSGSALAATTTYLDSHPRTKLIRDGKSGRYTIAKDAHLVNNLSWAAGFMELANAGDFAANVWNDVPVPVYAIVFMAIGATVAGFMSMIAFRDARRAWHNVSYLRTQRKALHAERAIRRTSTMDIDVVLAIGLRELGSELITRFIMDVLMGFGAVLICIGTYMAIGGANRKVWFASNLLSGYIGNAPIAVFGLINSMWAVFLWAKAQGHVRTSRELLGRTSTSTSIVIRRARKVQTFAVVNGLSTLLGGVGSLITATMWWGYVILIPVILGSFFCNIWWRKQIGYSRSSGHPAMNVQDLSEALEEAVRAQTKSAEDDELPQWMVAMPETLESMLEFLVEHSLFDEFCVQAVAHGEVRVMLGGDMDELDVSAQDVLHLPEQDLLVGIGREVILSAGKVHFKHRERYLAEVLGTYCALTCRAGSEKS